MSSGALGDLQEWYRAMLDAVKAAVPEAWDWIVEHADQLQPVSFVVELRAASAAQRFAMLVARDVAAAILARTPEGAGLQSEDQGAGPRWQFLHLVAVRAAQSAMRAPAVARWNGIMPGNKHDRRTLTARLRVEHALRTARPGELTSETLRRAGVSRSRGYEILAMQAQVKPLT